MLVWLGTWGYFALDGRHAEFVDAVFSFNLSYSSGQSVLARLAEFWAPPQQPQILQSALPLWIAAGGAMLWSMYVATRRGNLQLTAVITMIFASFIAVCMPGMFWPHYYQLLVPGCVILVAVFVASLSDRMPSTAAGRALALAVCVVVPAMLGFSEYRHYLSQSPLGITEQRYHARDFWAQAQGFKARSVTDPNDTIFVYGKDVGIYYYSGRRCASRFTMITGLQASFTGAERRRRDMMQDLEKSKPGLIFVLAEEVAFPEWVAFLHRHYTQPIGWDYHDRTGEPIMFVVARKDQPVKSIDWNWDRSEIGGWLQGDASKHR